MYILHVATEFTPVAKTGGLADVLMGLSRELIDLGHHVEVLLPKYDCINEETISDLVQISSPFSVTFKGKEVKNVPWRGFVEGVPVFFIEPQEVDFFRRGTIYGCQDDATRFLYFCHAAFAFIKQKPTLPDLVHIHDWPTALLTALFQEESTPHTLLSIHNLSHQGTCPKEVLKPFAWDHAPFAKQLQDPKNQKKINLLKLGIMCADFSTTVSPTYASEVRTPAMGCGLEKTIEERNHSFVGILNGIDCTFWDPFTDAYLPKTKETDLLQRKKEVREKLQKRLGLQKTKRPLIGCVTRLVPQKGVEQIKHAITWAEKKQVQLVLLGFSPIPEIQASFLSLAEKHEHHPHIRLIIDQGEELAHWIFLSADMILIPSLFEPCGLTQMIAFRYGAVPIVRKTGGLADTVFDLEEETQPVEKRNGFCFKTPSNKELEKALERAASLWHNSPEEWHALVNRNAEIDCSWTLPAKEYETLYKKACERGRLDGNMRY